MAKKKGNGNGSKGKKMYERYVEDSKGKVGHSAIKMVVEGASATVAGAGAGALFGVWSPLLGLLLIGTGHYFGDKTGLLRITGAACIGYGIAKAKENRASASAAVVEGITLGAIATGAKERLIDLKDNWLKATFLDKLIGPKTDAPAEDAPVGAIDLTELDAFETLNKEAAVKYELKKAQQEEGSSEGEILEGLNYALMEEELDFNTL
ncbi:MAG: hypothetical protein HYZ14_03090 [Bacteroidetes bacterium]|nr:hypothetical protein [Bacteroidota bacterium]